MMDADYPTDTHPMATITTATVVVEAATVAAVVALEAAEVTA